MKKILFFILCIGFTFSLDFSLEDVNPNSDTFGELVGPSYFQNQGQMISMSAFSFET